MPHIISRNHQNAWRSLLIAQSWAIRQIEFQLRKANEISFDVYEVLQTLEDSEGGKLRMSDLADRILFSRSGLTRMIDRLEELGYVVREPSPDDRRGWYAVVTPKGMEVRHRACDIVQTTLQAIWEKSLSDEEAVALVPVMESVTKSARDYEPIRG